MNYKEQLELWPDYRPNITVTKPLQAPPKILAGIPDGIHPSTCTLEYLRKHMPIPGSQVLPFEPKITLTPAQQEDISKKYHKVLEDGAKLNNEVKTESALRYNQGKLDWSLLPMEALEDVVKVLEFGKQKYAANNWRNGNGLSWLETCNSLRRHLYAWLRGEELDPESGISHLGHIGCNVIFLLYFAKNKTKMTRDDRA